MLAELVVFDLRSGVWTEMLVGVVFDLGSGLWAGVVIEVAFDFLTGYGQWSGMLVEVWVQVDDDTTAGMLRKALGEGVLADVGDDGVAVVGVLVEVVYEVGTGDFVVNDSGDILHVSPHLSGGLAQRSLWLKCVL